MNIPPGTRGHVCMVLGSAATIVLLPPGAAEPDPRTGPVLHPGEVMTIIRFDADAWWPDRAGRQMIEDGLEGREVVLLEFAGLSDALQCQARLRREGVE